MPVCELPLVTHDFQGVIYEYMDLFSSIPGIAIVEEFQMRTGHSEAVRIPPRMVPQAYQQEVYVQIEEMLLRKDWTIN